MCKMVGGPASLLSPIWISFEAIWSTVAPTIAPTVGVSGNLITTQIVARYLMASMPDYRRV